MSHFDVEFLDKNSERYMLSKRIKKLADDIESRFLVTDRERLGGLYLRDGKSTFAQRDEGEWKPFDAETEFWGYPDCYCWFKHSFTVPERFAGKPVHYRIRPYIDAWRTVNPQIIIYVNGKLTQGMDSNHQDVRLLDCAEGGERYDIYINAHADMREFKAYLRMQPELFTPDDIAKKLYYDIATPIEVADLYDCDRNERIDIVKALNTALNMVSIDTDDVDEFHRTANEAMAFLDKELYGHFEPMTASCIGHTHIDVAWLWRLRQTRDKAGRSFATVLKLMEEFPDYKFMSSQAQLYDYVKHDYPEVYEGIKQRVKEGRWEPEGSMWVEADTNVASGEALVRQFLVGKRFFREEFGVDNKIMWLPDVFGYSAALPQLIKKSGMEYFMTTKISWNEYNKFPFDTFMWRGIDGTEVLSHFSTGSSPSTNERENFQTTYNTYLSPRQVIGGWKRYSQKDLGKNYLISYGHGDGGGGPTRDMLEFSSRMSRGIPGCPVVKQEKSLDFFRNLEKEVSGNRFLPRWSGELYLEFHRGTLTSQARNKKYNRKSEYTYHDVETLSSIAAAECKKAYPKQRLNDNWKVILLNQFHDILPGSSIKEVYEDSREQYEEVLKNGREMLGDAENAIAADISLCGNAIVIFNTLGTARKDIVVTDAPSAQAFALFAPDGTEVAYQKTFDGKIAFIADVPAKGYKAYYVKNAAPCAFSAIDADAKRAQTECFDLKFDADMNIASLFHKKSGRFVAPEGKTLGKIIAFEDRPHNHDAWDIKCFFEEKSWEINDVKRAELVENGPVRAVYEIERAFRHSTIIQHVIVYAQLERIDTVYDINWDETHTVLKADYPVDVNATKATFDIQFGNIERSTTRNTTWDFAQFETSVHKWADLSDNSFGLSVINDCKYGCDVKDGHIRPTLLRCATDPNTVQDREKHSFVYSIYPHEGNVSSSDVIRQGYSVNFPLYALAQPAHEGRLPDEYSFVSVDCGNVVIETVKLAEDSEDIIVRAYETLNKHTDCSLSFAKQFKKAVECNLMEQLDEPVETQGNSIVTTFKPFEIKTFKITL
ncbi:MAG: alpha-mannosidase [Clostridiales bacterium]|nr:alpha-mannosidase [Clostridiales bacterium]